MKNRILYRYEIEYRNYDGPVAVILRTYEVKRETEKTYFIEPSYLSKFKRVRKGSYNTFAYPTKKEALDHFKRRTSRRIDWFDFWKANCQTALDLADKIGDGESSIYDTDNEIYYKYYDRHNEE